MSGPNEPNLLAQLFCHKFCQNSPCDEICKISIYGKETWETSIVTLIKITRWCSPKMEMQNHTWYQEWAFKKKNVTQEWCIMTINHRTRCQTIFSGSFVFLMFQGAWPEGSANQRSWISRFELKRLWNMKYFAFRHDLSQRNRLEISLESLKHLETSHELPQSGFASNRRLDVKQSVMVFDDGRPSWDGDDLPHFRMDISLNKNLWIMVQNTPGV